MGHGPRRPAETAEKLASGETKAGRFCAHPWSRATYPGANPGFQADVAVSSKPLRVGEIYTQNCIKFKIINSSEFVILGYLFDITSEIMINSVKIMINSV